MSRYVQVSHLLMSSCISRNTVRVVSTELNTTVTWVMADGTTGRQMVTRGHFVQIDNPVASQVMKVDCDKPCLVMLYNKGA